MRRIRKIAMVGREWDRGYARLLAGGLQYASTHPSLKVVLQPFTKAAPPASIAANLEHWGAEGIYSVFSDEELQGLKAALKHPIPMVNNCGSTQDPGVVNVVGDAHAWVELAVEHLRQLGLRHFGLLFTDPPPGEDNRCLSSFKRLTDPRGSVLILPTSEAQLRDANRKNQPVPAPLATWLRDLPKPCGVLCMCLGSGSLLADSCANLGLQVPDQIAIIAQDETDVCLSCTPTLTSIVPNLEIMGSESVRILLDLADGISPPAPVIRIKAVDFVVRESTGQRPAMICDIAGALEYIQANATKGLSVTQLIQGTNQPSLPTFYKIFRDATGKTPAQAIRERQVEEVRRLLATTQLPVAAVSGMAGFSSSNVMARLFRKVEGMPPLEYRRRQNKA
jgi:LacI family transcriptional regulator